jgi:hypothetical protein
MFEITVPAFATHGRHNDHLTTAGHLDPQIAVELAELEELIVGQTFFERPEANHESIRFFRSRTPVRRSQIGAHDLILPVRPGEAGEGIIRDRALVDGSESLEGDGLMLFGVATACENEFMSGRKTPTSKEQTAKKLALISVENLGDLSPEERKKKLKVFEDAVKRAASDSRARRRDLVRI